MDRCPKCNKRMVPVLSVNGRTEFQCLRCDVVEASDKSATRMPQPLPSKAA